NGPAMPWQDPHWRSGSAHWMQWSVMIAGASQRGQRDGAVSAIGGSFIGSYLGDDRDHHRAPAGALVQQARGRVTNRRAQALGLRPPALELAHRGQNLLPCLPHQILGGVLLDEAARD